MSNQWQWLFLEPVDVWFFRDNKPFTAAQNFVARSLFPPSPQTVLGALRTAFLEQIGVNWAEFGQGNVQTEVGTPTDLNGFAVQAPFVARYKNGTVERFFRAPLDLMKNKEKPTDYRLLRPADTFDWFTDSPFDGWRPLVFSGVEPDANYEETSDWLSESQFTAYLDGQEALGQLSKSSSIFEREARVGLALNRARRANERGYFYQAEFIRMAANCGLLAGVNKPLFAQQGVMDIGGESRGAYYYTVPEAPQPLQRHTQGRVRIILLTPAYFSRGWQPASEDWSPWVGKGGKLVSLAIGKPQPLSGWDVAGNQPRPLRNYLPAGSVFFFEEAQLTGKPFTETPSGALDHGAMGFGMYASGTW
ncbi:MAG: type III-B CRISPR module-associated protein Cmr3 [Aggregatilineales bacterium]